MTPLATLDQIKNRLADTPPLDLINQLMPTLRSDAVTWVRRLLHWDEYRSQHSDQAVSLARVISRRAMREFGLAITEDGRVIDKNAPTPRPVREMKFPLLIDGKEVQVRYFASYFSALGRDDFLFEADRNPLSETGYWHQFIDHDAVEAVGGPKAFAAFYADAMMAGHGGNFVEQFEGRFPEAKRSQAREPKSSDTSARPVLGEHTAAVIEAREPKTAENPDPDRPVQQGELF